MILLLKKKNKKSKPYYMNKNLLRSRNFMFIRRNINSCTNQAQLANAETLIALHLDIKEADDLLDLYKLKEKELCPETFEEEILNIHHKNL